MRAKTPSPYSTLSLRPNPTLTLPLRRHAHRADAGRAVAGRLRVPGDHHLSRNVEDGSGAPEQYSLHDMPSDQVQDDDWVLRRIAEAMAECPGQLLVTT